MSTPKKTPASAGTSSTPGRSGNETGRTLQASSITRMNNSKEPFELWAIYGSEGDAIRAALREAGYMLNFEHQTTLAGASTGLKVRTAGAAG
jgi:hypothetical protein